MEGIRNTDSKKSKSQIGEEEIPDIRLPTDSGMTIQIPSFDLCLCRLLFFNPLNAFYV